MKHLEKKYDFCDGCSIEDVGYIESYTESLLVCKNFLQCHHTHKMIMDEISKAKEEIAEAFISTLKQIDENIDLKVKKDIDGIAFFKDGNCFFVL